MSTRQAPPSAADLLTHAEFLRRLARRLVGEDHGAEDVVQEAFLAAVEHPDARRGPLRGWLTGVVRNLARMRHRSRGRRRSRELRAARPEGTESAADVAARMEVSRKLVAAVADLDERYRTVIVWRYFDELSTGEIAARLDVPGATVRTRLRRALAALRERLDDDHGGDRKAWCLALLPFLGDPAEVAAAEVRNVVGRSASATRTVVALLLALLAVVLIGGLVGVLVARSGEEEPARESAVRDRTPSEPEHRSEPSTDAADPGTATPARDVTPKPTREIPLGRPPDDVAEIRVKDADGRPVANATVALLRPPEPFLAPLHPIVGGEGRTDERGIARVKVVPFVRHTLRVSHPDYCVAGDMETSGGSVTSFTLARGGALHGRVTDRETGEGLPGMTVWVMDFGGCGAIHEWRVKTDENGDYRVEGIGPGMLNVRTWSRARPIANATTSTRVVPGGETRVDLKVGPGIVRRIRVVDADTGHVVPDVTVYSEQQIVARGSGEELVTTPVPLEWWGSITVQADGYIARDVEPKEFDPGRPRDTLVVRLARGRLVRGAVLAADGRPAAGLRVRVGISDRKETSWDDGGTWKAGETDEHGRFAVRAAGVGTWAAWEVALPAGGAHRSEWTPVPEGDGPIDLPRFEIRPTSVLRGTVVVPGEGTFRQAYVTAYLEKEDRAIAHCPLDSFGRFRLGGLPPGKLRFAVHFVKGWATQWWHRTVEDDARVVWTFIEGLTVAGRAVRDDGSPCEEQWVRVIGSGGSVRTHADGRFMIRGLLGDGPYRVEVTGPTGPVVVEDVRGGTHGLEIVVPRRR